MNDTGLKQATSTFQQANEGDTVRVILSKSHPIAKIRFANEMEMSGGFVSFKHGVLKIMNTQKKYVMIPAMIISEVHIQKAIAITVP